MYRRKFALAQDPTAGGSSYDDIVTLASPDPGGIPNPTEDVPVTTLTFGKNLEPKQRQAEVRGGRAAPAPEPNRAHPTWTDSVPPYMRVLARSIRRCFGGAPVRTGVAPAAFTDAIKPLDYNQGLPPAAVADLVRDALHYKVAGAMLNKITLDFPLEGDATIEEEWIGLYYKRLLAADAVTAAVFTGLDGYTLKPLGASVFIDGAPLAVPDFQGFAFEFDNGLDPKWWAGRNIVPEAVGSPRMVHFPEENRLHSPQTVGHTMRLGETNETEELKQDFSKVEKIVYEVLGIPMATTPATQQLFRLTLPGSVSTGGGGDALTKDGDIMSAFEYGAFMSDTDGFDVKAEFVHNDANLLTGI